MSNNKLLTKGVLYVVSCASSAAERVPDFVKQAQAALAE